MVHTQARCLRLWSPSLSVISAAFMAFLMDSQHFPSVSRVFAYFRVTYGQILLVGEDQEKRVPELVLVQHSLQLLAGLDDTVTIVAVNHEDDTLCVLEVMPP